MGLGVHQGEGKTSDNSWLHRFVIRFMHNFII